MEFFFFFFFPHGVLLPRVQLINEKWGSSGDGKYSWVMTDSLYFTLPTSRLCLPLSPRLKAGCWFPTVNHIRVIRVSFCNTHHHVLSSDSVSIWLLLHIFWNLHQVDIIMPIMWVRCWGSKELNDLPEATQLRQSHVQRWALPTVAGAWGPLFSPEWNTQRTLGSPNWGQGHCPAHIIIFSGQVYLLYFFLEIIWDV